MKNPMHKDGHRYRPSDCIYIVEVLEKEVGIKYLFSGNSFRGH